MLEFEHPELIWLFPLLASLLALLHFKGYRLYIKYSSFYHPLTRYIEAGRREDRRLLSLTLKVLLAAMVSLAAANPYTTVRERVRAESSLHRLEVRANPGIVVVLDSSGSMGDLMGAMTKIEAAKMAVAELVEASPENVDFGLVVFESQVKQAVPITGNRTRILEELSRVEAGGGTGYGPALSTALIWLKPYRIFNVSCAVVLVSDGMPGDKPGYESVLEEYVRLGIPIHTVYIGAGGEGGQREAEMIADETGGNHYTVGTVEELVEAFESIGRRVGELSLRTSIYVEVEVKKPLSREASLGVLAVLLTLWLARFYFSRIVF